MKKFIAMLLAGILCSGPFEKLAQRLSSLETKETLTKRENALQNASFALALVLFVWCIVRLTGGSYNPFIYFRF